MWKPRAGEIEYERAFDVWSAPERKSESKRVNENVALCPRFVQYAYRRARDRRRVPRSYRSGTIENFYRGQVRRLQHKPSCPGPGPR